MSIRTTGDRVRQALLFELIGLLLFIPFGTWLFSFSMLDIGVVAMVSSLTATLWNFIYNTGFDALLYRLTRQVYKTWLTRVIHATGYEGGLAAILVPPIAWYLQISLWDALVMDIGIILFYLVYAFLFTLAYDRVFPVAGRNA